MKLIAGLGNPGKEYTSSRHNIGFLVINRLSKIHNIELNKKSFKSSWGKGEIAGHSVILAKPQTYMNLSGEAISAIARYYKIIPQDIIVVHDDLDINFGNLKIKTRGGSGGHHGIDSVIKSTFIGLRKFCKEYIKISKITDKTCKLTTYNTPLSRMNKIPKIKL